MGVRQLGSMGRRLAIVLLPLCGLLTYLRWEQSSARNDAIRLQRDPAGRDGFANGVLGDPAVPRISPAGETHAAPALPIYSKIQRLRSCSRLWVEPE